MKERIRKQSESQILKQYPIKGRVDGWYFRTKEISNNSREVEGSDQWGRKVSCQGIDLEKLLEAAAIEARRISEKLNAT